MVGKVHITPQQPHRSLFGLSTFSIQPELVYILVWLINRLKPLAVINIQLEMKRGLWALDSSNYYVDKSFGFN